MSQQHQAGDYPKTTCIFVAFLRPIPAQLFIKCRLGKKWKDTRLFLDKCKGVSEVNEVKPATLEELDECYTVRGKGGFAALIAVQEKLQEHGLCSWTRWDPEPPYWRFFFETNLEKQTVARLLGVLAQRYQVFFQ